MKIFISHAGKNKKIVLKFAEFLESTSSEIEVFCSSEEGSIKTGNNFITDIFTELNKSDLFVAILSEDYYESRFCMIELGVAYCYLFNKFEKNGENYIFPFTCYPVGKDQALDGTPMSNIHVGEITDENDIRSFLEFLASEKGIHIGSGTNRKLHSFEKEINEILLEQQNIVELAKIKTCFDDSINYKKYDDVVNYSMKDNEIIVNFNINPYKLNETIYPNFISAVLGYADKLNIKHYLDLNDTAEFSFVLNNITDSLRKISVEFKHSDNIRLLDTFKFPVERGENKFSIPLKRMRSKALADISEICFVIHPEDLVGEEGMFKLSEIKISYWQTAELEELHKKQKAIQSGELLKAIVESGRSYEEILNFIQEKKTEE